MLDTREIFDVVWGMSERVDNDVNKSSNQNANETDTARQQADVQRTHR